MQEKARIPGKSVKIKAGRRADGVMIQSQSDSPAWKDGEGGREKGSGSRVEKEKERAQRRKTCAGSPASASSGGSEKRDQGSTHILFNLS